uniref:Uncharacterized protein n=1 Tax=Oryza rufipogon TaxID=4529 RepID=A0A0E0MZZ7_ORYRU
MGEVARVWEIGLGGGGVAAKPSAHAEAVDKSEIGGGAEDTGEAVLRSALHSTWLICKTTRGFNLQVRSSTC